MEKKYLPLRNGKPVKIILVLILFLLINFLGLVLTSTSYMEALKKTNSPETIRRIQEYIRPLIKGKYNYYLYSLKWNNILVQTPKLLKEFMIKILLTFMLSNFSFLLLLKREKPTSHGNAEWGTYNDLKKNPKSPSDIDFLSGNKNGFIIGYVKTFTGKIKFLYDTSMIHIAMFIATRGGKGVGYIIPSLIAGLEKVSTFITDIKKENYELTSWYRAKKLGHRVLKFEPMSSLSNSYNFLPIIRYGTENEIGDCRVIGTNIVGEINSNEAFWGESAVDTISTFTCYVHYKETSSRPEDDPDLRDVRVSLNDVISIITNTELSLYRIFAKYLGKSLDEDDEESQTEGTPQDFILKEKTIEKLKKIYTDSESRKALEKGLHPFIAKQFAYFLQNTHEETFKSITSTAKTKLQVFEIPTVVKNISESDFKPLDLVNSKDPVDLYFVIKPEDMDLLAPLVRIMYVQLTNSLMGSLAKKNFNIVMIMDELNAFGKIKPLIKGLGFYAGYGIKMVGIFQGLSQLKSTYGKQAEELLSGCQIQIFGRLNDNEAPKYVSDKLGQETVKTKSTNIGFKGGGSKSEKGKNLLSISEISLLPDRKAITITGFKKPLLLDKLYYYEYPDLLERTKHQPVFFKDGYVIFEGMKGVNNYPHTFKMKEEDFRNEEIYNKKISELRLRNPDNLIG